MSREWKTDRKDEFNSVEDMGDSYFGSPKDTQIKDALPSFNLNALKQKEIVIVNIMKEEKSLDVELEFGLKIYVTFVICAAFCIGGIILIFFSFGIGDLFKTNDRHVNVYGISFAAVCFLPMCAWLYVVFCPNKEEYRRRKSIRLDRQLRNAVERKKNAIFYDEDEELEESEKQIDNIERQIKLFDEETTSKNKRAALYASKKTEVIEVKKAAIRNSNDLTLNRINSSSNLSQQLNNKEKRNSFNTSNNSKPTRNSSNTSKPSSEVRVSFNLDNIERPSKKNKSSGKRVSPKM